MKHIRYFFYVSTLITLASLTLNLCNYEKYDVKVVKGDNPANIAKKSSNEVATLPFSISLEKLIREKYSSGKEKNLSALLILEYGTQSESITVGVNHPYFFHQYGFYLFDLGKTPSGEDYARLKVSVSKYRSFVFVGLALMIISSICLLIESTVKLSKRKKKSLFIALLLIMATCVAAIMIRMNPMLRSSEVPPILRSVWFLPHVLTYVVSYALMVCAWIAAFVAMLKHDQDSPVEDIFCIGLSFYTLGLVLGVIWAHFAWGSFWSWDIKETLALITWAYGIGLLPMLKMLQKRPAIIFFLITVFILLMLLCWFGPSLFRLGGMHSY